MCFDSQTTHKTHDIKALIFDVFGTLVDWRSSIADQVKKHLSPKFSLDWYAFADAWRAQYQPSMQKIRSGEIAFCSLDTLHLINLNQVINDLKLMGIDDHTKQQLNLAWHNLNSWPDVSPALKGLREKFVIAPCSNGNISLMIDLARYNDFHWDAVLGSEIAGNYKPHPVVYQKSVQALGLQPYQVMMVAAHSSDLEAAAKQGLKTAFIQRPFEHGPLGSFNHHLAETAPLCPVDFSALDLGDLLIQLS